MSKQLAIMWCVFNPNDHPIVETLKSRKGESWFFAEDAYTSKWMLKKRGYTCRKVRVTIEEVKL